MRLKRLGMHAHAFYTCIWNGFPLYVWMMHADWVPSGCRLRALKRIAVHLFFHVQHVFVQSKPQRHAKQKLKPPFFFGHSTLNCHLNACRIDPQVSLTSMPMRCRCIKNVQNVAQLFSVGMHVEYAFCCPV